MGLITSRALRYESWVVVGEVEFGWSCGQAGFQVPWILQVPVSDKHYVTQ